MNRRSIIISEGARIMTEELKEALELFEKADKETKALVVSFLKSPSQERVLLRKHLERDEQTPLILH